MRCLLLLLLLLVAGGTAWARAGETTTVTLTPGWNSLAFSCAGLSSVEGTAVAGMVYYDGTAYQACSLTAEAVRSAGGSTRGFWVYATGSGQVRYQDSGAAAPTSLALRTGWNLVACPVEGGVAAPSSLLTFELSARGAASLIPSGGRLQPGRAYWIYAPAATTLSWGSSSPVERPISLIFKLHLEPQGGLANWRTRMADVQAVRDLANRYGMKLSIHGNGEFWQFAREQGQESAVRSWITDGHSIGPHMHNVYQETDGTHSWRTASAAQMSDPTFVDALWVDHERELRALLPDLTPQEATPYNSSDTTYAEQMSRHGYVVSGGGREEVSEAWLSHHPFHPWRMGARQLEEDLSSPTVLVTHYAQFGEADVHGPDGTYADQSLAHHQVGFLLLYLNWLNAERTGDPLDKVWTYGFLTHDNKSPAALRAELEQWLSWLADNFGRGKKSLRGNTILQPATLGEVYRDYLSWESAHPGTSSFNVPTPTLSGGPNSITEAQRQAIYPEAFWGLAELLRADSLTVVNYVRAVTDFSGAGVSCHELQYGLRADTTKRSRRWLLWKESDGSATVNLASLTGVSELRLWNVRDKTSSRVTSSAVTLANDPVVVDLGADF